MMYAVDGSTSEIVISTAIIEAVKLKWINDIVDQDMEIFTVFPSSWVPLESRPWMGYCLQVINGRNVAMPCP